jgi:asparagine synthase (glutamine-hydrolysing)
MCGIAGVLDGAGGHVDYGELRLLADALAHRGPDGEGVWCSEDGRAGLVHRRLAIIDTSQASHQPMHSADGHHTIVYNGEIFNFLELRDELVALGHCFSSDGDTEVVLAAWRQWGEQMLLRFNGMWALALRDNRSGQVFLARDRFGIKPLLYAQAGGRLAFSSEMRALRQLPWVSTEIDRDVARRLLFDPFGVEASARSLVRGIQRLPAGHCAMWYSGRLTVRRWWCTADHLVDVPTRHEEQIERFRELFSDAIRLRMRSDVTIGTCLSGGFDSSAIVCEMSEVSQRTVPNFRESKDWRHAFIASFPNRSNDETPFALEAARFAGVNPHILDLSNADDTAPLDKVLEDLDDIYISLPTAPWQIYRRLREHGTLVSLDGHGADELMGGYRQGGKSFTFAIQNRLVSLAMGSRRVAQTLDNAKLVWLAARELMYLRGSNLSAPPALSLPADNDRLPDHWGPVNRRLYRMFHSTVLPTILRNFDRLSMAHGIEVRMPFMDWRLVCFVMSLPDTAKLGKIGSKAVARHAMSGRMPESIRTSQLKIGFSSPMPEWLNGFLGRWALERLAQPDDLFDSLVNRVALASRVHRLSTSQSWTWESAGRLWPYLNLKWYLERQKARSAGGLGASTLESYGRDV